MSTPPKAECPPAPPADTETPAVELPAEPSAGLRRWCELCEELIPLPEWEDHYRLRCKAIPF